MSGGKHARLKLLLRLRLLEVAASRRNALRKGKERTVAAAEREIAAGRHGAACEIEAEALTQRNANPGDAAFLFHSRVCSAASEQAEALLIECSGREAEADQAVRRARRELAHAETRHDGVLARLHAELARDRRRAERRRDDEFAVRPAHLAVLAR